MITPPTDTYASAGSLSAIHPRLSASAHVCRYRGLSSSTQINRRPNLIAALPELPFSSLHHQHRLIYQALFFNPPAMLVKRDRALRLFPYKV